MSSEIHRRGMWLMQSEADSKKEGIIVVYKRPSHFIQTALLYRLNDSLFHPTTICRAKWGIALAQ